MTDPRILLVEDDPVSQMVALTFLKRMGHTADLAPHGKAALELMTHHDYHLVLMDCQMLEMGGLEATSLIRDPRSAVRNHAVPVIALTAHALQGDRERCLAAGSDDYLVKPLRFEALAEMLDRWLPPPPSSDRERFDVQGLLLRQGGDQELARELLRLFLTKAPLYLAAMAESAAAANQRDLLNQAHTLKGAAATVGASRLATLAGALSELGGEEGPETVAGMMQQLSEEFAALSALLNTTGWGEEHPASAGAPHAPIET